MESAERTSSKIRLRQAIAWVLGLLIVCTWLTLPDESGWEADLGNARDDVEDETERLEIRRVQPLDPYPGSSLFISYAGARDAAPLRVFAGKNELGVIGRHDGELVARLPREVPPGILRIRIAESDVGEAGDEDAKENRSKPFFLRVKTPNWHKVFSSLIGGIALVLFGISLLSRGVRESTGLHFAQAVTRAAKLRSVAYVFGALTGAVVQSTTSAAGMLAALSSSGVLPLVPAALAFLGAQCGATVAPLLVTGTLEPREGLVAVTIGVLWLALAIDRRSGALARLVLGAGFVAFGLQVFRPGLEPFASDPMLLSFADTLRAESVADVALCALIGSVLVALMQGPAPLIVLILAVAQTTGVWDLTTALALLAGTGLGSAVAALLTASAGTQARRLARLHLWLGTASTLFATATVGVWSAAAELLIGPQVAGYSRVAHGPLNDLGLPLAVSFGLSQVATALLLSAGLPLLTRLRERQVRGERGAIDQGDLTTLRDELSRVLGLQQRALDALSVLAQTGARSFGQRAEYALADARSELERLVEAQARSLPSGTPEGNALRNAALGCLQLQHAIESLLRRAERVTEARLVHAEEPHLLSLPGDDEVVLRELHSLVSEGVSAMRESLTQSEPPDLDHARAREIKINRLESHARRVLHDAAQTPELIEQHLHVLQVIDAYEVVGNQVYRLTEAMGQSHGALLA